MTAQWMSLRQRGAPGYYKSGGESVISSLSPSFPNTEYKQNIYSFDSIGTISSISIIQSSMIID